jgi:uncharacterized integral membrane protein (TIGR00698 family)
MSTGHAVNIDQDPDIAVFNEGRSSDIYHDPQLARWLGSMEGVPDWPEPVEAPVEREWRATWQHRLNQVFGWLGGLCPGVVLALGLAFVGLRGASWIGTTLLGFAHSPISAIMVALLLGLLIRNAIGLPTVYEGGLKFCLRHVLRLGIMLLGLRLSLAAVGAIGLAGLPIIVGCIATALILVSWINRALGLPRRLGSLIAVGTSICGVSAIVATGPAVDAEEDEVSYAVACVTLFGLVALFTYPFLAHWIFRGDARMAGLFLGTAIHDTAQVAGAGLMYRQQYGAAEALDTAAVVKLVRNLFMAGVIPLMAVLYHRGGASRSARPKWHQVVPMFVLGFLALAALRSLGDLGARPFGLIDRDAWKNFLADADVVSGWCLTTAMAGVGLGTGLAKLRVLGWRPLCVGLAAAALVGGVSFTLISLLVRHT